MRQILCNIQGCDNVFYARGWCRKHWGRWQRHGNPLKTLNPQRKRGMLRSELVTYELDRANRDGACMLTVAHLVGGYGVVSFGGKDARLTRLVLEDELGRNLKPNEYALHICHRPACINPLHLYAGSHAQNMRDMVESGRARAPQGTKARHAKLNEDTVREIRTRYALGSESYKSLAESYGVQASNIWAIITRRTWKHI